jgi:hypothetical protein
MDASEVSPYRSKENDGTIFVISSPFFRFDWFNTPVTEVTVPLLSLKMSTIFVVPSAWFLSNS